MDLLLRDVRLMLRGDNDRFQSRRLPVLVVLYGDLCLSVRTKIFERPVLADLCQLKGKLLREGDWIRHKLRSLIRCVAEHHSLVTGADGFDLLFGHFIFLRLIGLVYAHRDIRRLLVHRNDDRTGVRVKSHFGICVADLTDRIPGDLLEIDIRF